MSTIDDSDPSRRVEDAGAAQRHAKPDITVVVVNYNTSGLLRRMFAALHAANEGLEVQTIVVDNASHDESLKVLRDEFPDVDVIANPENVGFGRANNLALPVARGRYVILLNTDAFVATDTLRKTVTFLDDHPDVGILGVKLVSESGALQPSCRYFPTPWNMFVTSSRLGNALGKLLTPNLKKIDDLTWDHQSVRECDWVPGCYYAVRREVIDTVGLFDPRYFMYFEEVDHCRTVQNAGWKIVYYPDTSVVHIGGESAAAVAKLSSGRQISILSMESQLLYFRKHYGLPGTLATLLLELVGDASKTAGAVVREKNLATARHFVGTFKKWASLVRATQFGSSPTR
ncbi:MAG: glycosyltransferase family 2 protein [Hyphomicrobium sp.]|uniref:glycosyltransferase family 2 protein n=1 Tax=Hyphomicrobium sp. TaxID=82 RepID=UPI0039E4CE06